MIKRIISFFISVIIASSCILCLPIDSLAEENGWDGISTAEPLQQDKVYFIGSPEELAWLSSKVNGGTDFSDYSIVLTNDIDLNNNSWTPIGKNLNNFFAGTFYGGGYTIKNADVQISIDSWNIVNAPHHTAGLFGVCNGAHIRNLKISNFNISIENESGYSQSYSSIDGTNVYAGAVCGYALNTDFKNITVENSSVSAYTGAESASSHAGGICGYAAENCQLGYCTVTGGTVSGKSQSMNSDCYAGGLVGNLFGEGLIYQSCNLSDVDGGHVIAAAYTGGLVGKSETTADTLSAIRDSYNQGNVTHTGDWLETGAVGGIIGQSRSTVTRCYNSGNVTASTNTVGGNLYCSGIAGNGSSSSTVTNCAVMSEKISGGTSNYTIASAGTKTDNIALSGISGPSSDVETTYAESWLKTSEPYIKINWDFENIWLIQEGEYPELREGTAEMDEAMAIVNAAVNSLNIIFAKGENYDSVKSNVGIPGSPNEATVTWSSTNSSVVSAATGTVNRNFNDTKVRLKATVSYNGYQITKTFVLNVLGTGTTEEIVSADWGMSLDDARQFVAYIRGEKFKDISADDPAVQVLIGNDIDEDHISEFMAEAMTYWEIPGESAYLKSQMGDVIGLIKKGQDQEIAALVKDFSGGLLNWDSATGQAELSGTKIASNCNKIFNCIYDSHVNIVDGFNKFNDLNSMKDIPINSEQDALNASFTMAGKLGGIYDWISSSSSASRSISVSKVVTSIKSALDLMSLYDAYKIESQNSLRSYIKYYIECRKQFDSPDDEYFKMLMSANSLNYMKNIFEEASGEGIDDIDALAETLYTIQDKFCKGLEDEYKIIIQCPVDVYVYDSEGVIAGRVIDNKVDTSILNSVKITLGGDNNDEKTVYLDNDEKYSVQLVGNDEGSMNVSLISSDNAAEEIGQYNNIPLTDGKEMIMDIDFTSAGSTAAPDIMTIKDGVITEEIEAVDSVSDVYTLNLYSCTEEADGKIAFGTDGGDVKGGSYEAGTVLSDLVTANEGYSFDGFYTDPDCTELYEYDEMPAGELTLFAKFKADSRPLYIKTQPVSGSYVMGESVAPLSVDCYVKSGLTAVYQWYVSETNDINNAAAIKNATEASYVPDTSVAGTKYYFVKITVGDTSVTSNIVSVEVLEKRLIASGVLDNGIKWGIDEDYKLTVSGSGDLSGFVSDEDVPWDEYRDQITSIEVKDDITDIGQYVFTNMANMKSLTVDKNVDSIAEGAFSGCSAVESISIPFVGVSPSAQNDRAVLGAIFGKVSSGGVIQYYASDGTTLNGYRYGIPESLKTVVITNATSIPFGAFYNCINITSVVLNDDIENIGERSFANCSGLTSLIIPNSVVSMGEATLNGCSSLQSLTIPFVGAEAESNNTGDSVFGYIFGYGAGTVQYYNLEGTTLKGYQYVIPESLTSVHITNEREIPLGAFSNCRNIKEIHLNSGIEVIDLYAFYNCTGLTDVYYYDTEDSWNSISINSSGNSDLTEAAIHYISAGDIDGSTEVNKQDAVLLLKYLSGLTELTDLQLNRADYNNDGDLNILDVIAILKQATS